MSCTEAIRKIRSENGKKRRRHGRTGESIHNTWMAIISRCGNPNAECWTNYGGRGIYVCERWMKFENFLEDMGEKPSSKHTIERRDNDIGYNPENCYWATRAEQGRNNRRNKMMTLGDKTMCMQDWSDFLGVSRSMVKFRKGRGWSDESALLVPRIPTKISCFLSSIDKQLGARERTTYQLHS